MNLEESLIRDLGPFADPATELTISGNSDSVDVQMVREGDDLRFTIQRSSGKLAFRGSPARAFPSLGALLADPLFSNIRSLSAMQRQTSSDLVGEKFLDPEGDILRPDGTSHPVTLTSVDQLLSSIAMPRDKLTVVLLDGQAGVGKTSLIRRILFQRAQHPNATPVIHVASRGNRLFGLHQLLAQSLDTLRAKFTFDQAPVLVRYGLIQIAIDGFDELVDSEGYADSWTALADFLGEVGGSGGLILAGRDTFFDQQVFNEKLSGISGRINFVNVRLKPVKPSRARDYLIDCGWPQEQLADGPASDLFREGSYVLRPYFLKALGTAEPKDFVTLLEGRTIRSFLVDRFIDREADLVRARTGISKEITKSRLFEVFSEIALEMAATESNSVDTDFIELAIDAVFLNDVSPSNLGRLKYKSGSFAFLELDTQRGYRKFPHTEISNHFLARAFIKFFGEPSVRRAVRRAALETDFFTVFSELISESSESDYTTFASKLVE